MSVEQIIGAIGGNDLEAVKELIEENPGIVNIENSEGQTPLFVASLLGHIDIVELLVTNGAHIDHQDTTDGFTPLSLAAIRGHLHVVEYLIIQGANVNLKINRGDTPLMLACRNKIKSNDNDLIIIFLLYARADINLENNDGHNAMYYARLNDNYRIMHLLTNI
jgi:ankyrin repeat protein